MKRNLIYYFHVSGETFCTGRLLCWLSALGSRLLFSLLIFCVTPIYAAQICSFNPELWFHGQFSEYPTGYDSNSYESTEAALIAARQAEFGPSGVFISQHTASDPCKGLYQAKDISIIPTDGVTPTWYADSGYGVHPAGKWLLMITETKSFCQYPGVPPVVLNTRTHVYASHRTLSCKQTSSQIISLTGPAETRPVGTAGSAPVTFTAKVTDGATPKVGVPVNFSVEVTPNSGGHEHHDINRPKAKLSAVQGTTDANGEVRLTFTAPEAAGIHTVRATCATCSNSPAVKEIKVKVPDLIQIPPDTQTPPRYVFVGQTSKHQKNHFVSEGSWKALKLVVDTFLALGWGQVGINDASLEWGGMFDIEGKWLERYMNNKGKWVTGGHAEHRNGEQVDISFARPASVSMQLRKKAYREVCNNNRTSLSPDILWHENDGYAPHFHIYLTGKAGAPAAGKNNQCTEK